ncbi:MAG: hypothetical protein JWP09_214 [Candidatus Taylorbacteria bacterium]|nr:hypothetical protein [Candidatus Taylorbacteria bacterium]
MKDIESVIKNIDTCPTPAGLNKSIVSRIQILEQKRSRQRASFFGLFSIVSFAGLVMSFKALWTNLASSGTYEYISLLVSNPSDATTFWKEISFSIIESVPLITLSLFLVLALAFIISSFKTVENIESKLIIA